MNNAAKTITENLTDISNEAASLIARMGSGQTFCSYRALAAKKIEEMQAILETRRVPRAKEWRKIVGYHLDAF